MRKPEGPWYRKSKDAWFVMVDGKQVRLAKGKKNKGEADTAFYELMAKSGKVTVDGSITVEELLIIFHNWSKVHHEPDTVDWYQKYQRDFCDYSNNGKLKASAVLPYHLTKWLDHKGWGTQRIPTQCVKRLFSWGDEQGILEKDPLAKVKMLPVKSRVVLLSDEERLEVLSTIRDKAFRRFVSALQATGARPGELSRLTAADVDLELGVWVLKKHKTGKKTGTVRTVYLTDEMVELSKELIRENPTGPLFTTMKRVRVEGVLVKRGFSKNGIRCRFRELRRKLPKLGRRLIAYTYRHSFATDALVKGVGTAQVAELLGHKDLSMLSKHYSHLSLKVAHLREAATKAVG